MEFQFGRMKTFCRWLLVTVNKQWEHTECHETIHLKLVTFILFLFNHSGKKKKIPCWKNFPSCCFSINQRTVQSNVSRHPTKFMLLAILIYFHSHLHFLFIWSVPDKVFFFGNWLFLSWKYHGVNFLLDITNKQKTEKKKKTPHWVVVS